MGSILYCQSNEDWVLSPYNNLPGFKNEDWSKSPDFGVLNFISNLPIDSIEFDRIGLVKK